MTTRICVVLGILLISLLGASAQGAEPSKADVLQEIDRLVADYEAAFNRHDAAAMAALWTPEGELLGLTGQRTSGREKIREAMGLFFAADEGVRLRLVVNHIRSIGPDAALVDIAAEVHPAMNWIPAEPRSTIVVMRQEGRWLIDSARNFLHYTPTGPKMLRDVAWLVGEWTSGGDNPDLAVESSCRWAENKTFLVRKFSRRGKDLAQVTGTEIIGWDPNEHRIRSWSFDSHGGFAEGLWTRDGEKWTIQHTGTLADGSRVSAMNVITPIDRNTVLVQSVDRTLNGQRQPDLGQTTIKRKQDLEPAVKRPAAPRDSKQKVLP